MWYCFTFVVETTPECKYSNVGESPLEVAGRTGSCVKFWSVLGLIDFSIKGKSNLWSASGTGS